MASFQSAPEIKAGGKVLLLCLDADSSKIKGKKILDPSLTSETSSGRRGPQDAFLPEGIVVPSSNPSSSQADSFGWLDFGNKTRSFLLQTVTIKKHGENQILGRKRGIKSKGESNFWEKMMQAKDLQLMPVQNWPFPPLCPRAPARGATWAGMTPGTAPRLGRRVTSPSPAVLSINIPICGAKPDPGNSTEPGVRLCS